MTTYNNCEISDFAGSANCVSGVVSVVTIGRTVTVTERIVLTEENNRVATLVNDFKCANRADAERLAATIKRIGSVQLPLSEE